MSTTGKGITKRSIITKMSTTGKTITTMPMQEVLMRWMAFLLA